MTRPSRTDKTGQRDHIHALVREEQDGYRYRCINCDQRLKVKSGVMIEELRERIKGLDIVRPDITRRCQNCGGTRKDHDIRKRCATKLQESYWKPWTVEEYEAAVKAGQSR